MQWIRQSSALPTRRYGQYGRPVSSRSEPPSRNPARMQPVSWLPASFRLLRAVRLPRAVGISPEKRLSWR